MPRSNPTFDYIRGVAGKSVAARFSGIIESAARKWHLDPLLVARVIRLESGFNLREVSNTGAVGLMQVMPFHFASHHVPRRKWMDPRINVDLGCHLLSWYKQRMAFTYPGLDPNALRQRTLVAYNMGPRAVSRGIYRSRYTEIILARYRPMTSTASLLPYGPLMPPDLVPAGTEAVPSMAEVNRVSRGRDLVALQASPATSSLAAWSLRDRKRRSNP